MGHTQRRRARARLPGGGDRLLAGLLAVLAGSAEGGPAGAVVAVEGVVVAVAAVRRITPRGMLAMRPGLPVATMALFCCAFAFFAVDGFVPLLLTAVDGRSVWRGSW